jgi:hypothetical protein
MAIRQVMAAEPLIFNTPVKYKGIQMRSALEARHAGKLDMSRLTWKYEPERFYSKADTYLPDFWVQMPDGGDCYLELNGATPKKLPAIKRRMEIIWETRPDAFLCIIIDQDSRMWGAHGNGDRVWRQG